MHLIIERALRRAKWAEEQAIAARYRHTLIQRARTFNESGKTIADEKRLPFAVQVPNATTARALEELEAGKSKRFDSADALFDDLGI